MSENKSETGKNFLVQGSILAIAGVITKIIGAVYRIPLVNILGDKGMGYYGVAFQIYAIALTLTSYSLPLAVSKLVSARLATGQYKNAYRVFRGAMTFAIAAGGIVGAIIFFGADFIASNLMAMKMSALALRVLAPCILIVAILVKKSSPGPIFFAQERIGLGNKPFKMYKFRSMRVQEESAEKKAWTTANDPRVTSIGKFMRKTNLDELPQIFNVLKGDMSLVGPRPERPYFVNKFKEEIPRYMIKHQVRPGMTGWAQVNGYRGDTSITKRIECDLYYVENWTLLLDFKILFLTFFGRNTNKNAY